MKDIQARVGEVLRELKQNGSRASLMRCARKLTELKIEVQREWDELTDGQRLRVVEDAYEDIVDALENAADLLEDAAEIGDGQTETLRNKAMCILSEMRKDIPTVPQRISVSVCESCSIRCPNCGSPAKLQSDGTRWECGWCGDFGTVRPKR